MQRSQAPLILRWTPDAVYLVGGAAGPLAGDVLELRIEPRAGAALRLRTAAAAVALPGRDGQESVLSVTISVAAGGRLEYLPNRRSRPMAPGTAPTYGWTSPAGPP